MPSQLYVITEKKKNMKLGRSRKSIIKHLDKTHFKIYRNITVSLFSSPKTRLVILISLDLQMINEQTPSVIGTNGFVDTYLTNIFHKPSPKHSKYFKRKPFYIKQSVIVFNKIMLIPTLWKSCSSSLQLLRVNRSIFILTRIICSRCYKRIICIGQLPSTWNTQLKHGTIY